MPDQQKKDERVTFRIPSNLRQMLKEALKTGAFMNESDFIRIAIREKLSRMGITNARIKNK